MKNKILICVMIIMVISMGISIVLCNTPRNNQVSDFERLKYGDSFILTIIKLGKPDDVFRGGIGELRFCYDLPDKSTVYMSFGRRLISLEVCTRIKDGKTIKVYVSDPKRTKKQLETMDGDVV